MMQHSHYPAAADLHAVAPPAGSSDTYYRCTACSECFFTECAFLMHSRTVHCKVLVSQGHNPDTRTMEPQGTDVSMHVDRESTVVIKVEAADESDMPSTEDAGPPSTSVSVNVDAAALLQVSNGETMPLQNSNDDVASTCDMKLSLPAMSQYSGAPCGSIADVSRLRMDTTADFLHYLVDAESSESTEHASDGTHAWLKESRKRLPNTRDNLVQGGNSLTCAANSANLVQATYAPPFTQLSVAPEAQWSGQAMPWPHRCDRCGVTFECAALLRTHAAQQHNVAGAYSCATCDTQFPSELLLRIHSRTHVGENNRGLQRSSAAKQTRDAARCDVGEKPQQQKQRHECRTCGTTFSSLVHLRTHTRTHTGDRPYKCDICFAGFGDSSNMRRHRRIHTGEKPYVCRVCGAAFNVSSNLKAHMQKVHAGVKPFSCQLCDAAFNMSSTLRSHVCQAALPTTRKQ
ncbi:PREDICTED: zinc finger protein 442-like isoform X2 [Priapulus caudatus]|nr:PREDICTED: zinc finger protein 442-like isoform X2 [Priapulus caudatus]